MSVRYDKRPNGVAIVTLDRPQVLNALDVPAKEALGRAWDAVAADSEVRAVVLRGAGPKAFCAGSDIKEMNRTGRMVSTETLLRAIPGAGIALDKPVIAALHGYCVGFGLTLAIHCDLRLAAADAVLGFPEVKHGMISGVSATYLSQLIAPGRALEMLLLGETIKAEEAERIGLVNHIVAGSVDEAAEEWAAKIASYPPAAVQATKRLAMRRRRESLEADLAAIEEARASIEARDDFKHSASEFGRTR
jgi:enoyl-CoA hydratase/carnithine racemase